MDDPRLNQDYGDERKGGLFFFFHRFWHKGVMRSGMVTGLILLLVVILLAFAYREQGHGHLHRLKERIASDEPEVPTTLQLGGQAPLTLSRSRMVTESTPEFLGVTLLPGRGMNILQIRAYIPGKGDVNLMASPQLTDAANAMSGTGDDASGQASMTMGGAFEVPWAGTIWGSNSGGQGQVLTLWRGHEISLPASSPLAETAEGGFLLKAQASTSGTEVLPDGGQAQATFDSDSATGRWPSRTKVTTTVLLSSHSIELTVTARNAGSTPEPIGIGWHPRFAVMDGDRSQLKLRIPGLERVETRDGKNGVPTGRLLSVIGSPYDFTARQGKSLGQIELDDCFVSLHQDLLDSGPVAEFEDLSHGYGLRLTALSPTIRAIRVSAPRNGNYITIDPQFNFPDPFGKEWQSADTGMVVLQPGESTEWKVRLEIVSPDSGTSTF